MANTLKFGNGEWYGKKDTILAYNDENSNYKPLPFNFSRASKATVINKDGLIEEVGSGQPRVDYLNNTKGAMLLEPSRTNLITQSESFPNSYWTKSGASIQADPSTQGSESVTNGNFATDSDWNKGTGWTISGGYAESDGTNAPLDQVSILTVGKTYKVVITVTNMTSSALSVRLGTSSSDAILSILENGTYTVYGVAGETTLRLRSQGFDGRIQNVSVKEVQGFTSLDGTNNAYKLVEGTNNGNHSISATVLVNSGNNSFSMYVKENGRKHISLYTNSRGSENDQYGFYLNGSGSVTFNNTNGDATITSLSNGWYRVSITHPSSGYNTRFFKLYLSNSEVSSNTIPSYQGDGLKGVYIYGSQVEAGSYSTSAISTSGSTVTRLADVCNNGGNEQVFNDSQGGLYMEFEVIEKTSSSYYIVSVRSSNGSDVLGVGARQGKAFAEMFDGTNYISNNSANLIDGKNKIVLTYNSGSSAKLFLNGAKVLDFTGTIPSLSNLSQLVQGDRFLGNKYYGNISEIKYQNTLLTDQEAIALTTI